MWPPGCWRSGAAAGVVAERAVVAKAGRADREGDEPFGQLRGTPVAVTDSTGSRCTSRSRSAPGTTRENLTIVFCHGYALNEDCWHYQRRDLRALGDLVFWDQRSHGRSSRSVAETNTIEQLGRDLKAVLDQVVPDRADRAGRPLHGRHDDHAAGPGPPGAVRHPHPRRGPAVAPRPAGCATSPWGFPAIAARPLHRMLPVTAALLVRNADLVEMGRSRVNDLSLLFTRLYSFGSAASPAVADFTHRMLGETSIDVVAEFLPTLQRHQRQAALHTLAVVPSLVMVGQGDRMTPAEHSLDMARRLPRSELEIMPDSGHMMILEHYPQVNHQLRRLVARVRAELAAETEGDDPEAHAAAGSRR